MPDLLKTVLPAAIAFVGTLIVVGMGYRQWKKQQELARYGGFLSGRHVAYKQLWEKLEAAHLYVRSEVFEREAFQELVRAANSHMIVSGLHLKDGEKERVNRYLTALESLGRCMADARASSAREEARDTLYATGAPPADVLARVRGLKEAFDHVEAERTKIMDNFRTVLGARFFE
jgi:phosphoenolpyruvate carboxylase